MLSRFLTLSLPGDFDGLGFDRLLLLVGAHRALERHLAVDGDDLDVVGVGRQRVVLGERAANLLRQLTVGGGFLLLIRRHGTFGAVALVDLGVVGRGLSGRGGRP